MTLNIKFIDPIVKVFTFAGFLIVFVASAKQQKAKLGESEMY
jgi:hypothetical protein